MKTINLNAKERLFLHELCRVIHGRDLHTEQKGTEFIIHCNSGYKTLLGVDMKLFLQEIINSCNAQIYGISEFSILIECFHHNEFTIELRFSKQWYVIETLYTYCKKMQFDKEKLNKSNAKLLGRVLELEQELDELTLDFDEEDDINFYEDEDE